MSGAVVASTGFSVVYDASADGSLLSMLNESSGPYTPPEPDQKKLKAMVASMNVPRPQGTAEPLMDISPVVSAHSESFAEEDVSVLQAQYELEQAKVLAASRKLQLVKVAASSSASGTTRMNRAGSAASSASGDGISHDLSIVIEK